jgi:phosphoserine phosphatase
MTRGNNMADDKTNSGGQDGTRIDVNQDEQLRAWSAKLDATPEQIRDAVQAVGDQAADVEMHLKGTRATTNADQEARAENGPGGQ